MDWFENFAARRCREAMKRAYHEGRAEALRDGTAPHVQGLMWALATRHHTRGILQPDGKLVYAELTPFLLIRDENLALSALCEYVIHQERRPLADERMLATVVSEALPTLDVASDDGLARLKAAVSLNVGWIALLNEKARRFMNDALRGQVASKKCGTSRQLGQALSTYFRETLLAADTTKQVRERLDDEDVPTAAHQEFEDRLYLLAAFLTRAVGNDHFSAGQAAEVAATFVEPLTSARVESGYDSDDAEDFVMGVFERLQEARRWTGGQEILLPLGGAACTLLYRDEGGDPRRHAAVMTWISWYKGIIEQFFLRFSIVD